jgi:hypothetical protein|eukprot:CAMPEP_0168316486 /NCGR_PEP_ID=MMETSP0210-20121227/15789_1 /TAXON_ID=40633 /ORGANISM="Condylostoma magnum, Strain COL2" /LENGTH=67 /DNA_ID=CAMNT_0008297691 /DNA_START=641 /DNA_END=844 /DNA_ORIENTATION=-
MQEILYVTPGNLYRLNPENNWELLEQGVGLLLIRKEEFIYFIDIVASNQIILRTALEVEANFDTNFE